MNTKTAHRIPNPLLPSEERRLPFSSCEERIPASTTQRIVTVGAGASRPAIFAWLRYENHNGANVYIAANPLLSGSRKRTKDCIAEVRHLYIDIDVDGEERIAALRASDAVPIPSTILSTSPGKYQALWRVEGFRLRSAGEHALKSLVISFGGDSACTDRNRVLRVPGFMNRKYNPAHSVSVEYPSDSIYHPEDFRLGDASLNAVLPRRGTARTYATGRNTHSERDWAWAVHQLSLGEDAANLTLELASRRSDKPNPLYYAERTIDIASARLMLLNGAAIDDVIAMLEDRRSADVPAALCSSRAQEIVTTAQRMIGRTKFASFHHPKENHNATA